MKIIRFEIFCECDIRVSDELTDNEISDLVEKTVREENPEMFHSDWWEVDEGTKS